MLSVLGAEIVVRAEVWHDVNVVWAQESFMAVACVRTRVCVCVRVERRRSYRIQILRGRVLAFVLDFELRRVAYGYKYEHDWQNLQIK